MPPFFALIGIGLIFGGFSIFSGLDIISKIIAGLWVFLGGWFILLAAVLAYASAIYATQETAFPPSIPSDGEFQR